ncbi:hypothetical protein FRC19_006958 [Serendipita sp. 401]|nr:hypothetical protein FRC19_006958 [Serendipita sp. 401]KAG8823757.1 hypothetical protein FRC18_010673 [Serendipita sp. 400]KAG9021291.1 hypothetical protein FS842_006709 [Serendipita sp. 407]
MSSAKTKTGSKKAHGYTKAAPKPSLSKEDRQRKYYNSLCDQLEGDHLENALKTTNKLLALDPEDADAIQTHLFLLLKTSRYQDALKVTESKPHQFKFERAYALYRLQRENDAAELLADEDDRAVLLLKAQISYRQGHYADALGIYNDLLSTSSPALEEYADIQTNIDATETNLNFLQSGFLTSIHQLPARPKNQSLEDTPLPSLNLTQISSVAADTKDAGGASKDVAPKPKPPRKSRVPKGVIPGVTPPPDPERWIKKSERTKVETGGHKKRKAGGGGATQGSMAPEQSQKPSTGGGKSGKKKK